MTPLALLVAGCNVPVRPDTTISQWESEGLLPRLTPTGNEGPRVYAEPAAYPLLSRPSIIVVQNQQQFKNSDLALAHAIRENVEYDEGLAPSLHNVTIAVSGGAVTLQGTVKSDLDSRVIVDNLRDVSGVTVVKNNLEIVSNEY